MSMQMQIGVLALQGGYAAHVQHITACGGAAKLVRTPRELAQVDGLIIPGGESSTLLHLLTVMQLQQPLNEFHQQQKPIFGTCAGMILLARHVTSPQQSSLGFIDIDVERNAYGRQLDSQITHTTDVAITQWQHCPLEIVFIRAPKIIKQQADVKTLVSYQNEPVLVQQHHCLAASFHPELSCDQRIHQYFIDMVRRANQE